MKLYWIPMILDSIIISITYGDFNQFFQTSILPVDVQHSITARRRRRSVSVFAFYKFFCRYPPLVFWKIDKQGGDICSDMDWYRLENILIIHHMVIRRLEKFLWSCEVHIQIFWHLKKHENQHDLSIFYIVW